MKISLENSELCLRQGEPVGLRQAAGLTIRCVAGTIWITSPGERRDIFLQAGACHRIRGRGLTLVESMDNGRIRLSLPEAGRPSGRWPAALIGKVRNGWLALRRSAAISRTGRAASAPGSPA